MTFLPSNAARIGCIAGLCLLLGGCGSISIPLGSLTPPWAKKSDDTVTGSITPSPAAGKVASNTSPAASEAGKIGPANKPFTLDAPADKIAPPDHTGSLQQASIANDKTIPKTFDQDDHAAVIGVLGLAMPDQGKANSQPWTSTASGHGGLVVPLAQLTKTTGRCRDLLISLSGSQTEWYKGEGCKAAGGQWQLNNVTAWRQTK